MTTVKLHLKCHGLLIGPVLKQKGNVIYIRGVVGIFYGGALPLCGKLFLVLRFYNLLFFPSISVKVRMGFLPTALEFLHFYQNLAVGHCWVEDFYEALADYCELVEASFFWEFCTDSLL